MTDDTVADVIREILLFLARLMARRGGERDDARRSRV
jgi:hypothetical protein